MATIASISQKSIIEGKTAGAVQQTEALNAPVVSATDGAIVDERTTTRLKGYQGVLCYPPSLLQESDGYMELTLWTQQDSKTSRLFTEIQSAMSNVAADGPGRAMKSIQDSLASVSLDVSDLGGYDFAGTVIQLPLSGGAGENRQEVSYNSGKDVGIIFGNSLPSGPGDTSRSFSDVMKASGGALAINKVLSTIGATLQNLNITDSDITETLYQTKFGISFLPFSYTLFDQVQHRTYNLEYYFSPRSAADQRIIYAILDTIQLHMLPERRNLIFHTIPGAWQIKYSWKTGANPWFLHSDLCYLATFNHTPLGDSTRLHADGSPMSHKITMSFIEIRPYDRQRFYNKLSEERSSQLGSKG